MSVVSSRRVVPTLIRCAAVLWLALWIPAYWHAWGVANFLHLCDIAVLLACVGLAIESPLLISSQAVASLVIDLIWTLDVAWRAVSGRQLIGGTEYLFDSRFPLWVRLLTLFHVALPFLLLWAMTRTGYDRRALRLQSGIAFAALLAARFAGAQANINFVFADPFHHTWGPAPVHIAVIFLFLVVVFYFPTHLLLARLFRQPGESGTI
ncbi:MAG: hypothetical protein ACRD4S_16445 [Candidatus Acidiferrales bacterium]